MPGKYTYINRTNFFEDVWELVKLIPKGRVTSYGSIARYLGTGSSARMVGWAMNAAGAIDDVPAHRVVNRNGMLSGKAHFDPPEKMEILLQQEGAVIENNCIKNFSEMFWDPNIELI